MRSPEKTAVRQWSSGKCLANGIEIHCRRTGGGGTPVVLLHGLMGSGALWAPFARALASKYDLVMPDARGHGQSSTPQQGYRYEDLAADVIELIRALRLERPVVLGHSMGGLTAAVVASQMGATIAGAILVDPTFLSPERQVEVFASDVLGQHSRLVSRGRQHVLTDLQARHPHRSAEILELLSEARVTTRSEPFTVLQPPNPDYREVVRQIEAPTLLVIADRGVVTPEMADELVAANPCVQVESIRDAGHGIPFDQPEMLAAAVSGFMQSIARTR